VQLALSQVTVNEMLSAPVPSPVDISTSIEFEARADVRVTDRVWARLLGDGVYLCSISTMYRLLAVAGENRERRGQRTHPARTKPELI
jgi:hypothetical protein